MVWAPKVVRDHSFPTAVVVFILITLPGAIDAWWSLFIKWREAESIQPLPLPDWISLITGPVGIFLLLYIAWVARTNRPEQDSPEVQAPGDEWPGRLIIHFEAGCTWRPVTPDLPRQMDGIVEGLQTRGYLGYTLDNYGESWFLVKQGHHWPIPKEVLLERPEELDPVEEWRPLQILLVPERTVSDDARIFTTASPSYLIGLFHKKELTSHQAATLANEYVGKWVELTGEFKDFETREIVGETFYSVDISVAGKSVVLRFAPKWKEQLVALRKKDRIRIVGQIRWVSRILLSLDQCELKEAKSFAEDNRRDS